jgi:hypothetical protein
MILEIWLTETSPITLSDSQTQATSAQDFGILHQLLENMNAPLADRVSQVRQPRDRYANTGGVEDKKNPTQIIRDRGRGLHRSVARPLPDVWPRDRYANTEFSEDHGRF